MPTTRQSRVVEAVKMTAKDGQIMATGANMMIGVRVRIKEAAVNGRKTSRTHPAVGGTGETAGIAATTSILPTKIPTRKDGLGKEKIFMGGKISQAHVTQDGQQKQKQSERINAAK